jgi:quercetin dioxygenase-like cupin family protein
VQPHCCWKKNEGETRLWRPEPGEVDIGRFILKVTAKTNGSQHLVLSTGEMASGTAIPIHKHLEQDEIVLIDKGTLHVHVGDQEPICMQVEWCSFSSIRGSA